MLDTSEDKLKNTPLRSALVKGGRGMQTLFSKRSRQLKASPLGSLFLLQPSCAQQSIRDHVLRHSFRLTFN